MTCTTECGYYKKMNKAWREAEREKGGSFVGICRKYNRKVSDIFCGCRVHGDGVVEMMNFEKGSWIEQEGGEK